MTYIIIIIAKKKLIIYVIQKTKRLKLNLNKILKQKKNVIVKIMISVYSDNKLNINNSISNFSKNPICQNECKKLLRKRCFTD